MTAIALTPSTLRVIKRAVLDAYPEARSAHLTEALATACGFATQAALLADIARQKPDDPDIVLLNDRAFITRLADLDPELAWIVRDPYWFDQMDFLEDPGIIATTADRAGPEYVSARSKAWRNVIIAGVNAGIERRFFTVRPGDNRWRTADQSVSYGEVYKFEVEGIPAIAYVNDAGFDELAIHVALWPTPDAEQWIQSSNGSFSAGEVFASGWLERRDGAWLQFSGYPVLNCRRVRLAEVVDLSVQPKGYAETGPFKM